MGTTTQWKKIRLATLLLAIWTVPTLVQPVWAFCGFYVAQAGAKLYNKSSQVILVRDGNRTILTMGSDYSGDAKDFAMVVPVPVVLQRNQIRLAETSLLDRLDAYSAPRLVEYYDQNPCAPPDDMRYRTWPSSAVSKMDLNEKINSSIYSGVKVEAKYEVGEYDILILSAKESTGLKNWLLANNYSIPDKAERVLAPYIKNNLKFFVVKVNLNRLEAGQKLSPIQLSFESERFMLPIRLGMANAAEAQDLIVYAFTKTGRVECANYRTIAMPTGQDIPVWIKTDQLFERMYKDIFARQYASGGKKGVFVEYAWNLSGYQPTKCDPCTGPPPMLADFRKAGIDWLQDENFGYKGELFFTRLHVRYAEADFPEDLTFIETPNREQHQARYVVHHPASGNLDCKEGKAYQKTLAERQIQERENLLALAGWDGKPKPEDKKTGDDRWDYSMPAAAPGTDDNGPGAGLVIVAGLLALLALMWRGGGSLRRAYALRRI